VSLGAAAFEAIGVDANKLCDVVGANPFLWIYREITLE
jgi:hypothetical protein